MSEVSKVFVLEPDPRAGRQLQLGFSREGVACELVPIQEDPALLPAFDHPGLLVVGGGIQLVRAARTRLGDADVPIVFAGHGAREAALAAGADEVIARPAYLRDLVTVGRLVRGVPQHARDHLVGNLAETTGVYTLIRALAALGRSAVLTLIRGLRRGEVRFFHGEVTSAQVGLIHGQAALHQLLLWTDARFELQHEDIVRRQQIPLPGRELFADAERFLEGVRDSAGPLSPAMVLEQEARVQGLGKQIPTEVHGVLRMFDGHRVLADVLEDSPYRVFETLRVAQKALEAGLLRIVPRESPKATWKAVLAIEEWLVGSETREQVVARTMEIDSGPVRRPSRPGKGGSRKRRKKRRAATPPVGVKAEIDWGALVPRTIGTDVGPLSGVVPTMQTAGEIDRPSREEPREKLEALMNTAARDKIFPRELEEPSVVLEQQAPPADDRAASEARVHESLIRLRLEREAREAAAAEAAEAARRAAADEQARDYAAKALAAAEARRLAAEAAAREAAEREAAERVASAESESVSVSVSASVSASESVSASVSASASASEPVSASPASSPPEPEPEPEPVSASASAAPSAPLPIDDSPSDGIVRPVAAADTAKLARSRRRAPSEPLTDGPPVTETTGELPDRGAIPPPAASSATSSAPEPSVLVADLAAAHTAAMAAAARPATPPPADAASPARELAVHEVRRDAVELSEAEEAFFRKEDTPTGQAAPVRVESFDDLDEGYERPRFWDRVFGRRRQPIRRPPTEK